MEQHELTNQLDNITEEDKLMELSEKCYSEVRDDHLPLLERWKDVDKNDILRVVAQDGHQPETYMIALGSLYYRKLSPLNKS